MVLSQYSAVCMFLPVNGNSHHHQHTLQAPCRSSPKKAKYKHAQEECPCFLLLGSQQEILASLLNISAHCSSTKCQMPLLHSFMQKVYLAP
mmetsp:Transcript_65125/g.104621  ORF Transcript_65125/g.104621 Transcript_65125/m.104621 type:complete len:91 (+) Transcript_65125:446-718(+)